MPEDPGQLPQPDKLTKAYFEVCSLLPLSSCHAPRSRKEALGGAGQGGEGRGWICGSCETKLQFTDGIDGAPADLPRRLIMSDLDLGWTAVIPFWSWE